MASGGKRTGAGRKVGSVTAKTREIAEKAFDAGITPLEYMLQVLRTSKDEAQRFEAAKAAAPYMHARLSTVEQKSEVTLRNVVALPPVERTVEDWQLSRNN